MLTLTFTIAGGATVGMHAGAVSGTVVSLVNQGTITFLSNGVLQLTDDRSGWYASGELAVAVPAIVGLYAYAALYASERINTAPLTGAAVADSLYALGVYGTPRGSPGDAYVSGSCVVGNTDVISALPTSNGCSVSLTAAHTRGAAATNVTVTYGSLAADGRVPGVVPGWHSRVQSTMATIQRVSACAFQGANLRAIADFGGDGLKTRTAGLDVTSSVTLCSQQRDRGHRVWAVL
jgi:hypothetical protein